MIVICSTTDNPAFYSCDNFQNKSLIFNNKKITGTIIFRSGVVMVRLKTSYCCINEIRLHLHLFDRKYEATLPTFF